MSVRRASSRWAATGGLSSDCPEGITITPTDINSGRAVSRRSGMVHAIADAAVISDGDESRLVAAWLCGGSTVNAAKAPSDADVTCPGCSLAVQLPQGPCVYFAWGDDDELLYIGSTVQAPTRIRAHIRSTEWWDEVRRLTFDEYSTEPEARDAEASAIWSQPGLYNRASTRAARGPVLLGDIAVEVNPVARGGAA